MEKSLSICLPEELVERLQSLVDKSMIKRSRLISEAVWRYLELWSLDGVFTGPPADLVFRQKPIDISSIK